MTAARIAANRGSPKSAQAAPPPQPTEEQVQMAWRHLRNQQGCPSTLEAVQAHRVWSVALHGLAVRLHRQHAGDGVGAAERAASRLGSGTYVPPVPTASPRPRGMRLGVRIAPRAIGIDRKRAAANDFDE